MFVIGRRKKTRSQLVREQLQTSLDHFRQAATYAAGGVGTTVGPRVVAARDVVVPAAGRAKDAAAHGIATFGPLATAAAAAGSRSTGKIASKANVKNAKALRKALKRQESSGSGKRKLAGLLVAGAAVGAVGALIIRSRRQEAWDSQEPDSVPGDGQPLTESVSDTLYPAPETAKDTLLSAAESNTDAGVYRSSPNPLEADIPSTSTGWPNGRA